MADATGFPVGGSVDVDVTSGDIRVTRARAKARRAEKRIRRITQAVGAFIVVFVAAAVVLMFVGWNATMEITGGKESSITDPAAPGYTAEAGTTDVQLVVFKDPQEHLATGLLLIGGAGKDHVSVVPISSNLIVWEFEDAPPGPIRRVYDDGGIDVLLLRLGADLTFGIGDSSELPLSILEPVFERVGPVTIDLPDVVYDQDEDGRRQVKYNAGPLSLQPDEFAEFLTYTDDTEGELNRSLRVDPLWAKIIESYSSAPASVTDPISSAVGLSLWGEIGSTGDRSDLQQDAAVETLPLEMLPLYVDPPIVLSRVDTTTMSSWVPLNVPFPLPAYPGQRVMVSLLDGGGGATALTKVSPLVVGAGGSIGLTGNAMSFDRPGTTVEYSNRANAEVAGAIASQLGVVASSVDVLPSGVDVQVTVGKDQA